MRVLRVEKEQSDFGTTIAGLFIITHHFHAKLTQLEMCVYMDLYLNERVRPKVTVTVVHHTLRQH